MSLRRSHLRRLEDGVFDVLIVGGGINGAVSAACLAARGVRVALLEAKDFASVTSQESSNLAWGGIKYMESYEFGLVRKLCMSRNHLIRSYPSTVQEIRFYTMRPRHFRHSLWLLVLGTWLYWAIGNFFTKRPRLLRRATIAREEPLIDLAESTAGFEYSDSYLHDNDARFVWNFIRGALDHGAVAVNYVESTHAERASDGLWTTQAIDRTTGQRLTIRSRVRVNACGPYVDTVNDGSGVGTAHHHVFSKGVHLIVRRLTNSRRVLTFFADDGRLFFVIPMGPRTCIGTTDTRVDGPHAEINDDDRRFILDNINKRLRLSTPLAAADIIAERCGVRPLVVSKAGSSHSDWMQLSRKHVVEVDPARGHISIFGGKLTDCLNVGEEVGAAIARMGIAVPFPRARWYGEPSEQTRQEFVHQATLMRLDAMTSPRSSEPLTSRLWRRYGAEALGLLEEIRADPGQAEVLIAGAEYLRCEIAHAARREMIVKLEDFLRRRSKIALVIAKHELAQAPGLRTACELLFGEHAEREWAAYFAGTTAQPSLNTDLTAR
jgi:glycerol-3-phosphate dehydrogenase